MRTQNIHESRLDTSEFDEHWSRLRDKLRRFVLHHVKGFLEKDKVKALTLIAEGRVYGTFSVFMRRILVWNQSALLVQ